MASDEKVLIYLAAARTDLRLWLNSYFVSFLLHAPRVATVAMQFLCRRYGENVSGGEGKTVTLKILRNKEKKNKT